MPKQFKGKVSLVTGAASGIGRATALAFAREGAKVVIDDIQVEAGEKTRRLITESGGEAIFVEADVRKAADVETLINKVIEKYGRLDFAHNNAGIEDALTLMADCTEENWDNVTSTNLKGVWLCMKYEIRHMLKQSGGAIVNTASTAGLFGAPKWSAYAASKGGVVQLTRTAALEYAKAGIRINAVCPGGTQTSMHERAKVLAAGKETPPSELNPQGRRADPKEIAAAVVWLCSDAASFVTGHPMVVDGGMTAR